jgi:hypothetical protein
VKRIVYFYLLSVWKALRVLADGVVHFGFRRKVVIAVILLLSLDVFV